MSLNFRKGIIYEYEENVRIYNDYFNLVLEKEKVGGPVVVKAIELRRKTAPPPSLTFRIENPRK